MDAWQLGAFLRGTLLTFFWFAIIWMFAATFADILHSDMSGWARGGWALLIVALPLLGILVYLVARPHPAAADPPPGGDTTTACPARDCPIVQIIKASELYESGTISATEFQDIKRRTLT